MWKGRWKRGENSQEAASPEDAPDLLADVDLGVGVVDEPVQVVLLLLAVRVDPPRVAAPRLLDL